MEAGCLQGPYVMARPSRKLTIRLPPMRHHNGWTYGPGSGSGIASSIDLRCSLYGLVGGFDHKTCGPSGMGCISTLAMSMSWTPMGLASTGHQSSPRMPATATTAVRRTPTAAQVIDRRFMRQLCASQDPEAIGFGLDPGTASSNLTPPDRCGLPAPETRGTVERTGDVWCS